jgi:hypothetical protein
MIGRGKEDLEDLMRMRDSCLIGIEEERVVLIVCPSLTETIGRKLVVLPRDRERCVKGLKGSRAERMVIHIDLEGMIGHGHDQDHQDKIGKIEIPGKEEARQGI